MGGFPSVPFVPFLTGTLARGGTHCSTNVVSIDYRSFAVQIGTRGTVWNAMIFIALVTKSDRCRGRDRDSSVPRVPRVPRESWDLTAGGYLDTQGAP